MRIAQFRADTHPKAPLVVLEEDSVTSKLPMYTRVSEWTEIEFRPLPLEQHLPRRVRALDTEANELRSRLAQIESIRAAMVT